MAKSKGGGGRATSAGASSVQAVQRAPSGADSFVQNVDRLSRGRGNQRTKIFADRARDVFNQAYGSTPRGYERRYGATDEQVARADRLINMGWEEALYGAGRTILR